MMGQTAGIEDRALDLLRRHGEHLNGWFKGLRARCPEAPDRLLESIEYSLLAGGKRLRPALVLECALAVDPKAETNRSVMAAAAAIELIHTFSLVHDDLPAMDNDDLRRGVPTNHKVFGEAMAILAGDAMVTMAFEIIAHDANPKLVPALIRELAAATGPEGMIGGQVLDMDGETRSLPLSDLQRVHRLKTGALLTSACRLGVIASGASEGPLLSSITDFGKHMGLAFQIVDDVLDVTSTPEKLGKATAKDAGRGKNTYPSLLGLDESRREAARQLASALESIKSIGPGADGLRALARFVVERNV
jgi:geranylgeranyl diphosphate synthase type II